MNVAFIPVRSGSKSISLKNIKMIAGKPLVYWVLRAANDCKYIDRVFVATDAKVICDTVNEMGFDKVHVIERSRESATDEASTEFAMLEFALKAEFDNIVLIQATSPLLETKDLNKGFELFYGPEVDSVLSVVKQKRFIWEVEYSDYVKPSNYDIFKRPRRQEFDGFLVENGAFYITSKKCLIESGNRLSGKIKACEMDEKTYYEIDEKTDWIIIEKLLENRENSEIWQGN